MFATPMPLVVADEALPCCAQPARDRVDGQQKGRKKRGRNLAIAATTGVSPFAEQRDLLAVENPQRFFAQLHGSVDVRPAFGQRPSIDSLQHPGCPIELLDNLREDSGTARAVLDERGVRIHDFEIGRRNTCGGVAQRIVQGRPRMQVR